MTIENTKLICRLSFSIEERMEPREPRHGRRVGITTWEECSSGRALREHARYN
jgi:hypothetical protein